MAKRIIGTTPKQDGYRMPAEFEPQQGVWMLWPERNDNWRDGGKPAQKAFADVAKAIAKFEKVTVGASVRQYQNARAKLPENIRVVELESDDAWVRDCGPTFLVNDKGGLRAVDWEFNAWGGLVDGLYFPWDKDDQIARKICEIADVDSYRTEGFVLEGGSIHVDGEGTVLTTEMCLLSEGRNPDKSKEEIEQMICDYLGCEKVLWIKDGIDPDETNGHIDDVACFVAPGEVACIWTEDKDHPFYEQAQAAYRFLSEATDAKGRKLKVHKLCLTKKAVLTRGRGYHRRRGGHHPPRGRRGQHRVVYELFDRQRRGHLAAVRRRKRRSRHRTGAENVPRPRGRGRADEGGRLRRRQYPLHHPAAACGEEVERAPSVQ